MRQLGPTDLKRLHRGWARRTSRTVALLLENVQSPWNVGAITRTAAALRVDHVFLAGTTIAPGHPKAGRTAMGTDRYLQWSRHEEASSAIRAARERGLVVVGLELADEASPLWELPLDPAAGVCLALGHEDHGLTPACLRDCDHVGFIPQLGRVGSFSVSIAAGIGLYELRRQEWMLGAEGADPGHRSGQSGPGRIDLDP